MKNNSWYPLFLAFVCNLIVYKFNFFLEPGILLKCAENSMHANITHSIFHAFKNMPCSDNLFTDQLLSFVKDDKIDPEKRIHAFRAALACPTEYALEHLVAILEKEPSKQVASYMWTTFTNIMESKNPDNEA